VAHNTKVSRSGPAAAHGVLTRFEAAPRMPLCCPHHETAERCRSLQSATDGGPIVPVSICPGTHDAPTKPMAV